MMSRMAILSALMLVIFPNVYAQTNQPCGTTTFDCYQETGFRLDSNPVVCIDMLSDTTFGHKVNIYTMEYAQEWDSNVQFISSASSPLCNISVHFQPKPTPDEQSTLTDAIGITHFNYDTHSANIEIFLDDLLVDGNGNFYYSDSQAPDYQLQWSVRHELGHAFGLGHYMVTQQENDGVLSGAIPPSIMIPIIPDPRINGGDVAFNADITQQDLNELQSLYPHGFGGQASQQSPSNTPTVTSPTMSASEISYWSPLIRGYFANSTNKLHSDNNYPSIVLALVDLLDSEHLVSIPDPVGNLPDSQFKMYMPYWFVNVLQMWGNSEISDNDLALDIQYLYNNGLFYFQI